MDDQLDNDLKNRIREVFDNFEDRSADEGWLQLREKYPEEQANRRPFAWIWWGAAAILFLFLGIGLWIYSKNDRPGKYFAKTSKHTQHQNLTAAKSNKDTSVDAVPFGTKNSPKTITPNTKTITPNTIATHLTPSRAPIGIKKNIPVENNISAKNSSTALITKAGALKDTGGKKTFVAKTTDTVYKTTDQSSVRLLAKTDQSNNSKANSTTASTNSTATSANSTTASSNSTATSANSTTASVTVKPKPAKTISDMLLENQTTTDKQIEEKTKRVHFGVYAATYFNYAKGSNNNANLGAGVTADIKIAKNLKLVTGVMIAQNSLNFTSGVPTTAAQSNLGVFDAAGASSAYPSAAYDRNSAVTNATVPAFKNYDASLVGLDVPLNLKYDFDLKKNNIYILAGFSSGTFINETYTYQYNYPALLSPSLQKIQDETATRSFNGFYFAKTLNLAFGFGYPLGKNSVILEPFLKYPLDGLGSQNIRFGAGGINLKFNFQSPKK